MSHNYEIKKQLGRGNFAKVFLILKDSKYYALKKISTIDKSKDEINDIKKEINILKDFNSEYIVKFYDYFKENDNLCILMEYGGESNLKSFINKYKNKGELIDEQIIKDIILQICLGLNDIHKAKIIHRDLTPENIFINENNKIKIGDFGVSKKLGTNQYTKSVVGKYQYFSPELIKQEKYDYRADIYALGCIIYELFTLNTYYIDKNIDGKEGVIDLYIYNKQWQILIENLVKKDYHQRPNAEEIYNYIININIKKNISSQIDELTSFLVNFEHLFNFHGKYNYIKNEQKNLIINLYNKGLISDIRRIEYKNNNKIEDIENEGVVAYKLISNNFSNVSNNWIHAWHGTSFRNLESIIQYGLKLPGTFLKNGKKTPKSIHIPENAYGIKNWEDAIFATPCLACSSVFSVNNLVQYNYQYPYSPSLVEILIKPNGYTSFKVEELVGYFGLRGGELYCGFPVKHNDFIYRITSEKNIIIKSIVFLNPTILTSPWGGDFNKEILSELNNLFTI